MSQPPLAPPPSTPPTPPTPATDGQSSRSSGRQGRTVPVKWVVSGIGALIVLTLTFYAGMVFENNRIKSNIEEAFSGFDESLEEDFNDDAFAEEDAENAPEPVELVDGTPVEVEYYDGAVTVTVLSTQINDEAAYDDVLTRNLQYQVKIENTGTTPVSPSFSGHYETDAGQVLDFAGVFCDEDSLPSDTLEPGQFVQGCESSDLPDDSGRLVFDEFTPELYLTVPAA